MENNFRKVAMMVLVGLMASCAEKPVEKAGAEPAKKNTDEPKQVAGPDASGKDYTEDAIAYAMNSKDLGTWTYCLNASKWVNEAKSGEFTFLAVTDGSLERNERIHLRELTRVENKKLLDDVVGRHILKGQFRPEDLLKMKEVETISGVKLKIDANAGSINGLVVSSRYVASPKMYILVIDDIIGYPLEQLKESISKRSKE